jgi:hypothetical protein
MAMYVRRLRQAVTVTGKPVFGFGKAFVTIDKPQHGYPYSWFLDYGGQLIPITAENVVASTRFHNLAIRNPGNPNGHVAHVLEHLLPLKAAGLLGATIRCSHCLPYSGSMQPVLNRVLEASDLFDEAVPVRTVGKKYRWEYPQPRGAENGVGFTEIEPSTDGQLVLDLTIHYPGQPKTQKIYPFPDLDTMQRISGACAQGWPPKLYGLSKVAGYLGLWAHHNHVSWMQDHGIPVRQNWLRHRCLDVLGAVSLLADGFWFAGIVTSVCSGHVADLMVCKEIEREGLVACRREVTV